MPGSTVNAAAELISRTWPLRFAISGSAACAVSIEPIRLTSIVRARACAELVITVVSGAIPALATTMSSPPKVSTVRWTAAFSASGSVTSASTHRCSGPSSSATAASSLRLQPDQRHAGAPGGRLAGQLGTDAAGGAGDQHRLAGQGGRGRCLRSDAIGAPRIRRSN